MTDLRQHWKALEDRLSLLLQNMPSIPKADQAAIQDYIDHNEFGLAFELLIGTAADLQLLLTDDQHLEMANLAQLMRLPAQLLEPLKRVQ
jgi:hypothetical protein